MTRDIAGNNLRGVVGGYGPLEPAAVNQPSLGTARVTHMETHPAVPVTEHIINMSEHVWPFQRGQARKHKYSYCLFSFFQEKTSRYWTQCAGSMPRFRDKFRKRYFPLTKIPRNFIFICLDYLHPLKLIEYPKPFPRTSRIHKTCDPTEHCPCYPALKLSLPFQSSVRSSLHSSTLVLNHGPA